MTNNLLLIGIGIVVLYIGILVIGGVAQERMIFVQNKLPRSYKFEFPYDFDELRIASGDGKARLSALHFKVDQPKGVVLYFHGNAGHLADWGWISQDFLESGFDFLIMDYRGYGKSSGSLSEKALYSDAEVFYDYVKQKYPEEQIILYGRSLGTTFATHVAAKNNPSQLILETPFYSMVDLAQMRFPMFPIRWLLRYPFPTHKFIGGVKCPITIFHGTKDRIVPYSNGKKLAKLIPESQLRFITIPEGKHNNLAETSEYQKEFGEIFSKNVIETPVEVY